MADRLECEVLDDAGLSTWAVLVEQAGGSVFHTRGWIELVSGVFRREGRVLGVLRNGQLIGGCPVYQRSFLGFSIADPPVLAGYTGALVSLPEIQRAGRLASATEHVLAALEAGLRRRYAYARLEHEPRVLDARPFQWGGWDVAARFTYRLRLASEQELFDSFEQQVRTKIRKAERAGLTCHRVAANDESLSTYEFAYKRHGLAPPVPMAILSALAEGVVKNGCGRAYVARDPDGKSRAFEVILTDGARAYAWIGGADAECLREGGYTLLHWKVFADLSATHPEIDLLGANTPRIASFKRSFGGELVPYWETTHTGAGGHAYLAARAAAVRLRRRGSTTPED